jgi:hypothetical protein
VILAMLPVLFPAVASADSVELVPLRLQPVSHTVCFDGVGSEAPAQCASGEASATLEYSFSDPGYFTNLGGISGSGHSSSSMVDGAWVVSLVLDTVEGTARRLESIVPLSAKVEFDVEIPVLGAPVTEIVTISTLDASVIPSGVREELLMVSSTQPLVSRGVSELTGTPRWGVSGFAVLSEAAPRYALRDNAIAGEIAQLDMDLQQPVRTFGGITSYSGYTRTVSVRAYVVALRKGRHRPPHRGGWHGVLPWEDDWRHRGRDEEAGSVSPGSGAPASPARSPSSGR